MKLTFNLIMYNICVLYKIKRLKKAFLIFTNAYCKSSIYLMPLNELYARHYLVDEILSVWYLRSEKIVHRD